MNLYDDEIMRLARSGFGAGHIADGKSAYTINPLCGDECRLSAQLVDDEVIALAHDTRGCALCLAAAAKLTMLSQATPVYSTLCRLTIGLANGFASTASLPSELLLFTPVISRKSRHQCVLLPFQALLQLRKPD